MASKFAWFQTVVSPANQTSFQAKVKITLFDTGWNAWDYEGLAQMLGRGKRGASAQVCKDVKRLKREDLPVWCHRTGLALETCVMMSRRQIQRGVAMSDWARQHVTHRISLSTQRLLMVLTEWCSFRQAIEVRDRTAAMMKALCATFITVEECRALLLSAPSAAALGACGEGRERDCCQHVLAVMDLHQRVDVIDALVARVRELGSLRYRCAACGQWLGALLRMMASIFDAKLHDDAWGLVSRNALHPAEDERQRTMGREIDRAYRAELVERVLGKRKCHGQGAVASLEGVGAGTTDLWKHDDVLAQCRANVRTLGKDPRGVFHIIEDGARLGQPAKETNHFVIKAMYAGMSCVGAPQASLATNSFEA